MSKMIGSLVALAAVGLIGNIIYSAIKPPADLHLQLPPPVVERPSEPAEAEIRYPLERPLQEKPLPALDQSDTTLKVALNDLLLDKALVDLFQTNDFVRHVAATVDNIPRQKIAQRLMPIRPAAGTFAVAGIGENAVIDPANAARYAPFMRLLATLNTEKAVALYGQFYPLFQRAYEELGYPNSYFNDRVIAAIDHLLATPDVEVPIKLVRPKVLYQYADPELEALSAGQKAMLRIGADNAAQIKAKLREIRSELMRQVKGGAQGAERKN